MKPLLLGTFLDWTGKQKVFISEAHEILHESANALVPTNLRKRTLFSSTLANIPCK